MIGFGEDDWLKQGVRGDKGDKEDCSSVKARKEKKVVCMRQILLEEAAGLDQQSTCDLSIQPPETRRI